MDSGSVVQKSEANEEPVFTVETLDMVKQISAVFSSGFVQSSFWEGISFGLYDTVTSTITIGFDLEMDRIGKYMRTTFGSVINNPNEYQTYSYFNCQIKYYNITKRLND